MDVRDHGWFVFFAPHDKPEIAGVIFAERAEHGYDAAPIAKYVMETYFAKKEGRPLPTLPPKVAPGAAADRRRRSTGGPGRSRDGRDGSAAITHVRTPPLLPRRLAAARGRADPDRHRRGDDLQHHLRPSARAAAGPQFYTQIYAIGLGLAAMLVCLVIDYRKLAENSLIFYVGLIALLIYVLFQGSTQFNATRWIAIGPFNLQPSEFGRITLALMLAMFFGENRRGARNTGDLVMAGDLRGGAAAPDRPAAGPRHRGHADPGVLRHRLSRRPAPQAHRRPRHRRAARGVAGVGVRAQGLPARPHHHVHQSRPRPAGGRLSAAAGADHGRFRRPDAARAS